MMHEATEQSTTVALLQGDCHKLNLVGWGSLEGLNGVGQRQRWDAHASCGDSRDRSLLIVVVGRATLSLGRCRDTSRFQY